MPEGGGDMARAIEPGRPVRSCAGCHARDLQAALLRLALVDGRVTADPRRRLPGRGAYVHRQAACVERAIKRGGLARAFRAQLSSQAVARPEAWLLEEGGSARAARGQDGTFVNMPTIEGERS
jgi:uncharacterized protein